MELKLVKRCFPGNCTKPSLLQSLRLQRCCRSLGLCQIERFGSWINALEPLSAVAATTCEAPHWIIAPWTHWIPPARGLVRESFGHAAAAQRSPEGDSVPRMAALSEPFANRSAAPETLMLFSSY